MVAHFRFRGSPAFAGPYPGRIGLCRLADAPRRGRLMPVVAAPAALPRPPDGLPES
jgi:hypothetical protein